jgi:muconolactone delta-isomerase
MKPLSYSLARCHPDSMDHKPVNRAERIRARAWKQAQAGNLERYWRLVGLSLEVGSIRPSLNRENVT